MLNQRGSALINAIVVAGIVAAISSVILMQTKTTDESSRAPRIRAAMAVMQARVQALASLYTSYTCPNQNQKDFTGCSVNKNVFSKLTYPVTGAQCPTGQSNCGVTVNLKSLSFDDKQLDFKATIEYQGTEVAIHPVDIVFKIPADILASQMQYMCGGARPPIFNGYDPVTGKIRCINFPTACTSAGLSLDDQGTYISGLDPNTLQPECNTLGDGSKVTCTANQYLTKYAWQISGGSAGFVGTCGNRQDPFAIYPYVPTAGTPGAAITTVTTPVTPPAPSSTTTTVKPTTTTTTNPSPPPLPPCKYCKSGVGWCGNPPACNICVPAIPVGCTPPAPMFGTWTVTMKTAKAASFTKMCTYTAPASGTSPPADPLPSKCTAATQGATAICGYGGFLWNFVCKFP